jgi:hypothetical protein
MGFHMTLSANTRFGWQIERNLGTRVAKVNPKEKNGLFP